MRKRVAYAAHPRPVDGIVLLTPTNFFFPFSFFFFPFSFFFLHRFCGRGDLRTILKDENVALNWFTRIRMANDIACAMAYLHSRNVIFRDLSKREGGVMGIFFFLVFVAVGACFVGCVPLLLVAVFPVNPLQSRGGKALANFSSFLPLPFRTCRASVRRRSRSAQNQSACLSRYGD